jgi:hypothetical protein
MTSQVELAGARPYSHSLSETSTRRDAATAEWECNYEDGEVTSRKGE